MSVQEVPEELRRLGIQTIDEWNITKKFLSTKFFESKKPKPTKAKVVTGGKKTERQIFLGRIASASDLSRSKVDEMTPEQQRDAIKKRGDDFRRNMSLSLGKTVLDEADVLKIVKLGTSVLLDMHVFEKTPTTTPESTSSQPQSTD